MIFRIIIEKMKKRIRHPPPAVPRPPADWWSQAAVPTTSRKSTDRRCGPPKWTPAAALHSRSLQARHQTATWSVTESSHFILYIHTKSTLYSHLIHAEFTPNSHLIHT
jgi:hypothetical protein